MRAFLLLTVGLIAYAGMLLLSQKLFAGGIDGTVMRVLVSLSPMLPVVFICGVVVRNIRRLDEMQRKLQFEAIVMAFAATALMTFGYGFLEGAGLPKLSMFVVWPLMATFWVIGVIVGRLRFG